MLLIKTDSGQAAFKERSPRFSSRQRSAFILVDGKKTAEQLLTATAGLGVVQADLDYMIEQGFLSVNFTDAQASAPAPLGFGDPSSPAPISMLPTQPAATDSAEAASPAPSSLTEQERYQLAKPLATQLTAGLGLRGFMLNLSVESAAGYQALLDLFPQIQKAVGAKAARELERALKE
jgi:hypothetical protein